MRAMGKQMKTGLVMLQWNHWRNGMFTGVLHGADFDGVLTINSPFYDSGIKAKIEGSCVVLGGKNAERFEIISHREWVGNWCWDAVRMSLPEMVRMANWLIAKGFRPEMGDVPIFDAASAKEQLTVEHFLSATT